jgi:hypothetical protein
MKHPVTTYEGTPCAKAGHTLLYTANRLCVACHEQYKKTPKNKERERARRNTPEGTLAQYQQNHTPEATARRAAYAQSDQGKAARKIASALYFSTPKGQEAKQRAIVAKRAVRAAAKLMLIFD